MVCRRRPRGILSSFITVQCILLVLIFNDAEADFLPRLFPSLEKRTNPANAAHHSNSEELSPLADDVNLGPGNLFGNYNFEEDYGDSLHSPGSWGHMQPTSPSRDGKRKAVEEPEGQTQHQKARTEQEENLDKPRCVAALIDQCSNCKDHCSKHKDGGCSCDHVQSSSTAPKSPQEQGVIGSASKMPDNWEELVKKVRPEWGLQVKAPHGPFCAGTLDARLHCSECLCGRTGRFLNCEENSWFRDNLAAHPEYKSPVAFSKDYCGMVAKIAQGKCSCKQVTVLRRTMKWTISSNEIVPPKQKLQKQQKKAKEPQVSAVLVWENLQEKKVADVSKIDTGQWGTQVNAPNGPFCKTGDPVVRERCNACLCTDQILWRPSGCHEHEWFRNKNNIPTDNENFRTASDYARWYCTDKSHASCNCVPLHIARKEQGIELSPDEIRAMYAAQKRQKQAAKKGNTVKAGKGQKQTHVPEKDVEYKTPKQ